MVKQADYEAVVQYVKDKLIAGWSEHHGNIEVVRAIDIINAIIPYDQYLVASVNNKKSKKKVPVEISKEVQKHFEVFWQAYPGISRFEYMGKKFEGERVLKANKQICLKLYNDAVQDQNNKRTAISNPVKDILKAMQVQVETIKQESYKTGVNKLQYLKACEVYFRQKAYESWIGQEMPIPPPEQKLPSDYSINI